MNALIINLYRSFEFDEVFFRGSHEKGVFYYSDIRSDRKPMTTHPRLQKEVNKYFQEYGFETNRSNCIFTSSMYSIASRYGDGCVYIVFPINGFKFLWSPHVTDLTLKLTNALHNNEKNKTLNDIMISFGYDDKDLKSALESTNEVMISGKGYYALSSIFHDQLSNFL